MRIGRKNRYSASGIHDPVSLTAAAAIVVALALCASLVPAARAARADPATELRHE